MARKIKGDPVMQLLGVDLITPESENWAKEREVIPREQEHQFKGISVMGDKEHFASLTP